MLEMDVIKNGGFLFPYLDKDKAELRNVRRNQAFKIALVRQSDRSVQHNKLYWGGLIKLAADFWEPEPGCLSPNEEAILKGFIKSISGSQRNLEGPRTTYDALDLLREDYIARLKKSRANKYEAPAVQYRAINNWILEELGRFDLYLTPSGWKKELHHINFNAMPTEGEFLTFYQEAFGVVWNFLLSRNFASEAEAHNVINELSEMG
jgi:hypothetical protein